MNKFLIILLFVFFFIAACKDKSDPQPSDALTVLEGRVLNADNSTPVGNIGLTLYALYKNDDSKYSTRLFNVNQKGEYTIEFKASADSGLCH